MTETPPTNPPFPPFALTPAPTETAPEPRRKGRGPNKARTEGTPAPEKRKKANGDKAGIKLDLATAMDVAAMLNADDRELFEQLVALLSDAGKPARDRLLAAIGKIFE